jgi:hypothetical protein
VLSGDRAAAKRREADRAFLAAETCSDPAEFAVELGPAAPRRGMAEQQRRSGRRIGLQAMMDLGDLDIPLGPEDAGGALDQLGEQGDAERSIGSTQHGDLLRRFRNALPGGLIEPGRADENWYAQGQRAIEAVAQRVG